MWAVFSSLFPSPSSACGETLLSLLPSPAFSPPESASPQTQGWSSPSSWKRGAGRPTPPPQRSPQGQVRWVYGQDGGAPTRLAASRIP